MSEKNEKGFKASPWDTGNPCISKVITEPPTPTVGEPFKLTVKGYNFDEHVNLWVRYCVMGFYCPHPDYAIVTDKKVFPLSTIVATVRIDDMPGDYDVMVGRMGPKKPEHTVRLKVYPRSGAKAEGEGKETPALNTSEGYDVFISHASEDEDFVRPLAEALRTEGLRVWYDEFSLKLGDRLRESIEKGLAKSRYGVVIVSKNFFGKDWPQRELDALFSLERGEKKILPIWYGVSKEEVENYSTILASRVAAKSSEGIPQIVRKILDVIKK